MLRRPPILRLLPLLSRPFASFTPLQLQWKAQFLSLLPPESTLPVKLKLDPRHLAEEFMKGGGKGGQKVNKANNCVRLTHTPTAFSVKVHSSRDLETNRNLAKKRLLLHLDELVNGQLSRRARKEEKIRR